ncbi:MAG: hypothetical protein MUF31_05050 [Akkermansiaceae bacterium]|jgi:L,D-peptidoglycan transpeptidase YkuD (ErfK/YbiS/YcfS/YnhG family)|nr:hypothetical protein [Akkermansiaceae bacterium]
MRFLAPLLAALALVCPLKAFEIPADTTQLIVGVAADWNSSHVTLTAWERQGTTWRQVIAPWPGRLGKNGLVWGLGIHPLPAGMKLKAEGDGRAPAGVFELGDAWGSAPAIRKLPALRYRQVTPRDLWVEDPKSPQYNRHVALDQPPSTAWEKKQQMKQNDPAHALKLFIKHNAEPNIRPGAGSAIFFHIWRRGGNSPSAGCTTMDPAKLQGLVAWVDPTRKPLYVLLPKSEYDTYRPIWKLP